MSSIIYPAPKLPGDPMPPSVDANGHSFEFCMFFDGGSSIAYADSHLDLMDVLLPGYAQWDSGKQLSERIHLATSQAIWVQAQVWADNTTPLTAHEEELLGAPRTGEHAPTGSWECQVPLVVVASAYSPFTDIAAPVGYGTTEHGESTVWMIDPSTEETLLTTLHEVGALRLLQRGGDR